MRQILEKYLSWLIFNVITSSYLQSRLLKVPGWFINKNNGSHISLKDKLTNTASKWIMELFFLIMFLGFFLLFRAKWFKIYRKNLALRQPGDQTFNISVSVAIIIEAYAFKYFDQEGNFEKSCYFMIQCLLLCTEIISFIPYFLIL